MERPIPSGRSLGRSADRDQSSGMIRLAQLYLETRRTGKPICPLLERAWLLFYAEVDTLVHDAARSCRVKKSDLDDCVQETWRAILTRLPAFRLDPQHGQFGNWIIVIVRRVAIRLQQRRDVLPFEPLQSGVDAVEARDSTPSSALERAELRADLVRALVMLRGRVDRLAYYSVILHDIGRGTKAEVADRLALSPGQVRGYLERSRRRLQCNLSDFRRP